MKISLKWLSDYIDINDYMSKPQELVAMLTAAGLEVESLTNLAKQFENVVVGSILEKGKHPNADRLTLCQVSTGEGVVHQIVCGAQNHNSGDRVVVALPGAILPGDFAIKQSKIRGVDSGGMLCSEKELGISSASEGILILPKDAPLGESFAKYRGLDDIIMELKVTPNRADCLSHLGVARELACLLGRAIKIPPTDFKTDEASTKDRSNVKLEASETCPRYAGRVVQDVKIGPSPAWLQRRLELVDIKPINNVVDITNYVMLEMGQPLHAFDLRQIHGGQVIIRNAEPGEKFKTLDGTELTLDGSELTIRDNDRALALAGIIGGLDSGIKSDTTDVFIESAYFTPGAVRRTARKVGVETDSSYRFSRGVNPEGVPLAMDRCARLISEIASGIPLKDFFDVYPKPLPRAEIEISKKLIEDRLGYEIKWSEAVEWMKRLGAQIISEGSETMKVGAPLYRFDLHQDIDLVEEFARLHGYQHIPETLPEVTGLPLKQDQLFEFESRSLKFLKAEALQAINFAFLHSAYQQKILGHSDSMLSVSGLKTVLPAIALVNPLNEELDVMRVSLLPGLIKNITNNASFGNLSGELFEMGQVHLKGAAEYTERKRLGFAVWGEVSNLWLNLAKDKYQLPPVMRLKSSLETWLRGLGVQKWKWIGYASPSEVPQMLHPGQAATLEIEGARVGILGTLHPLLAEDFKLRVPAAVAEIDIEAVIEKIQSIRYMPISRFPAVDRDLAFVMPKGLAAGLVAEEIRNSGGELLREIDVFDLFEGASLGADKKSVAYRLIFQDREATLEDTKVNQIRDGIVSAVTKKFGIELRA